MASILGKRALGFERAKERAVTSAVRKNKFPNLPSIPMYLNKQVDLIPQHQDCSIDGNNIGTLSKRLEDMHLFSFAAVAYSCLTYTAALQQEQAVLHAPDVSPKNVAILGTKHCGSSVASSI